MKVEEAAAAARKACYALADLIGDDGLLLESHNGAPNYNDALDEETKVAFPGSEVQVDGIPLFKRLGHAVHWILFESGMGIDRIGDHNNSWDVVTRNGFKPELVEDGIGKYRGHIAGLAAYIDI